MQPGQPEAPFFKFGRAELSRREFFTYSIASGILIASGIGIGVAGTLATQLILNIRSGKESIPLDEEVRGTLLSAFDDKGNSIEENTVYGSKLVLLVNEQPAPAVAITQVEATGNFPGAQPDNTDSPGGWPIAKKLPGPNLSGNYLFIMDLDNLNGQQPPIPGGPFNVSINVTGVLPEGHAFKKSGEPGPLTFNRT